MSTHRDFLFGLIITAFPVRFWRDIEEAQYLAYLECSQTAMEHHRLDEISIKKLQSNSRFILTDFYISKAAEKHGINVEVRLADQCKYPYYVISTSTFDLTIKTTNKADELPSESKYRKQLAEVNRQVEIVFKPEAEEEAKAFAVLTHGVAKKGSSNPGHLVVGFPIDNYTKWEYFHVSDIIDHLKESEIIEPENEHIDDKVLIKPKHHQKEDKNAV